jgi:hypothetical protein
MQKSFKINDSQPPKKLLNQQMIVDKGGGFKILNFEFCILYWVAHEVIYKIRD